MRKFRYIKKGYGKDSLTDHEVREIDMDYDITTTGFYVLAPLTRDEWRIITTSLSGAEEDSG